MKISLKIDCCSGCKIVVGCELNIWDFLNYLPLIGLMKMEYLTNYANTLILNGYRIIPVLTGKKSTNIQNWTEKSFVSLNDIKKGIKLSFYSFFYSTFALAIGSLPLSAALGRTGA